jgi:hypothetical protein
MKTNIFFMICISVFWGCKSIEEPKVVCDNFVLEKYNWKFCTFTGPNGWQHCGGNLDTLEIKTIKHIDNIQANVHAESAKSFCIYARIASSQITVLFPVNLPTCFGKDELKIIISGDIKKFPIYKLPYEGGGYSINESCGDYFEITKIAVAP